MLEPAAESIDLELQAVSEMLLQWQAASSRFPACVLTVCCKSVCCLSAVIDHAGARLFTVVDHVCMLPVCVLPFAS